MSFSRSLYFFVRSSYNKRRQMHNHFCCVRFGQSVFEKRGPIVFHKPMYGATIAPACEYCAWGRRASDPRMILCEKCGIVSPYYKCRKFRYDPLRRVPKRPPKLPAFSPEDFSLD